MFLRHKPLLEVNQANISLVVYDNHRTLKKRKQNIFVKKLKYFDTETSSTKCTNNPLI